jgi:hypothetical protein
MRESIPYKIIGGVRFYERKEIKDALAYLKLIINPHDDVSLRRVINVPARGVGKGVMDSLQAIDPDAIAADAPPLLAAGLPRSVPRGRCGHAWSTRWTREARQPRRRSLRAFRDLHRRPRERARPTRSRSPSARCSTGPATCKDLRDENTRKPTSASRT